jgi:hypothetical protein
MNIVRYESQVHRDADRKHQYAQTTGRAVDYIAAAEMYEKCGDFNQARVCREAAAALGKGIK